MPEQVEDHAQTVRDSLSRNVVIDAASRVGYMVSRFFVPPFVLARISLEAYGLWSTAFILVSYIGVSTVGISNVYIKYVAEYTARRDYKSANSLVSTGLMVTVPTCLLLFGVVWIGWPLLADWLHIAPYLRHDAREVVLSVLAIFLTSIGLSAFHDVLVGVQRTALVQCIWTASYIAETSFIFFLVGIGRGIRGLAEAYVIRALVELALSIPIAFRVVPWLRISPALFSKSALRTLFSFGSVVQIQSLFSIFLDSVERAIAAPLLGLESTALLDIGQKLPTMAATVPNAFASAFLPAASYLHVGLEGSVEQRESVRKLYLKGARYMNLAAGYICAFIATIALPLLDVWMGKRFPGAAYLLVVFAIATQFHLLTGPGTSILRGIGRLRDEFYYLLPNLGLLAILVPLAWVIQGRWTTLGIGTAVPAATVLASLFFVRHSNRVLGVAIGEYVLTVALPGVVPYLLALAFTIPVSYAVNHTTRWMGAAWIVLAGLVYSTLIALVVDRFVWSEGERLWFHAVIRIKLGRLFRFRGMTAENTAT